MREEKADQVEKMAKLLHEALEAASPPAFVGDYQKGREITLDGSFDLRKVAKDLLRQRR